MTGRIPASKELAELVRSGVKVTCDLCGKPISRANSARVDFDANGQAVFRHRSWTTKKNVLRDCTMPRSEDADG